MDTQKDISFDYRRDVISAILNELTIRFENRAFHSTEYCMEYLEVSLPWLQDFVEKYHETREVSLTRTSRAHLPCTIKARSTINHKNEQRRLTLKPQGEQEIYVQKEDTSLTQRRQQIRQSVNRYKLKRQMTRLRHLMNNNSQRRNLNEKTRSKMSGRDLARTNKRAARRATPIAHRKKYHY